MDGVSLQIKVGERVAIIGQNGRGKSTLVRHCNGLLRPTEGRVLVDGVDGGTPRSPRWPGASASRSRIRTARSSRAGSGREVAFGPRNVGVARNRVGSRVDAALAAAGLADDADANPYDLGYSRRKLLALASVLAMQTPVVVLDEPTTGQDARGVARVGSWSRAGR